MRIVRDAVRVQVPATSANLGPGFDAFGLALAMYDVVEVRATTGATHTTVIGEGAGVVPGDENHLVVKAIRTGLEVAGAPQAGLELRAHNTIPHGRGLGSSAAAVVAGLVLARGMISDQEALSDEVVLALASEWEGHPDNAAAALLGGATLAWSQQVRGIDEEEITVEATRLAVDPALVCTALIPTSAVATKVARSVLPPTVPHADAAFTAGRAAMLVLALAGREDLRLAATEDVLHQPYRREVLASSMALVGRLRAMGLPAVISGAGPTVLVLGAVPAGLATALGHEGWSVRELDVDHDGARLLD